MPAQVKKKKRLVKFYDYQSEGIHQIDAFGGRALLADDPGLGKSVQSFGWGHWRLRQGKATVIVCPASIKEHWRRECLNHFGRSAVILEGRKPQPDALKVPWKRPVFIINYDILGNRNISASWSECLKTSLDVGLVIADECHRIASRGNISTKGVKHLVQNVPHFIPLSGTPLVNTPAELWSVLNMLDPEEFPNYHRFAARYCVPDYTPWGVKYKGARRLKELHRLLKEKYLIRRLKKDVLKELPPKVNIMVPVTLTKPEWQEYMRAETDFVNWLRKTRPEKAESARKAERLVKFNYLKQLIGQLKRPHVEQYVEELSYHRKVLTFTWFVETCDLLHKRFKSRAVKVDGSVTGRHRQAAFDRFTQDKDCDHLFGNIKAAGVGWPATVTDTVVFAELAWTPGDHIQASDRPHRIGQKNTVNVHWMFVPGTLEEKLLKLIQDKQKALDGALDGLDDGEGDFRVFDLLERAMTGRRP